MQVSSDKTLDLHWMHHQTQWRMPYSKLFSYSQKRRWVDKMFMHWKVDFLDKLLIPLGWKLLTVLPRYLYKSLGHYSWKLFEFRQILHTLNTTNLYITKNQYAKISIFVGIFHQLVIESIITAIHSILKTQFAFFFSTFSST